jgi:ribosome-binding ATPase YchF (GTP1/OBG family)
MDNYNELLQSLKELLNTKFEELEKRLEIKDKRTEDDINKLFNNYRELESRVDKIENSKNSDKVNTWQNVKENLIRWMIPLFLMGFFYFIFKQMPQ